MFPNRNLELYFWDDEICEMNCEAFDVNFERDIRKILKIEIVIMDYPIGDEVAIVTFYGDRPLPLSIKNANVLYTVDGNDNVINTTVAYSPNPEYNDILLMDSPKEAGRYTLYSRKDRINLIDYFVKRDNPFDMPIRSER